jgi:hypothetical protein
VVEPCSAPESQVNHTRLTPVGRKFEGRWWWRALTLAGQLKASTPEPKVHAINSDISSATDRKPDDI